MVLPLLWRELTVWPVLLSCVTCLESGSERKMYQVYVPGATDTDIQANVLHSPPQDTASSSPAWAHPVEVLQDTPAVASSGRELQKAPCLGFEPGSCPWEDHSCWGCSWVIPCWLGSCLQGVLVGLAGS